MVQSLRKYICKRGSALFMVISTMTALMVTCMAMFFSVVSARDAQYAVFNQKQSYQSAMSIAEAFLSSLNNNSFTAGSDSMISKLAAMSTGDTLSGNGNDYASLISTGSKDDVSQLGGYSMDITRLDDDSSGMAYEMFVTTSVNGSAESLRVVFHIAGGGKSDAKTQLFTATGYAPNEAYVDGGYYITDVFFDTETAYVGAFGGTSFQVGGNFSCGGNLVMDSYVGQIASNISTDSRFSEPTIFAVGGNLDFGSSSGCPLNPGSKVIVGGNFTTRKYTGGVPFENADIYVNNDLIIKSGRRFTGSNVFVNGNIDVYETGSELGNLYINGNINVRCVDENIFVYIDNSGKVHYSDGTPLEYNEDKNVRNGDIINYSKTKRDFEYNGILGTMEDSVYGSISDSIYGLQCSRTFTPDGSSNAKQLCNLTVKFTNGYPKSWESEAKTDNDEFWSLEEMKDALSDKIASKAYPKWEINDNDPSDAETYVPELNESSSTKNVINISMDCTKGDRTYVIGYPGSESVANGTANVEAKAGILEVDIKNSSWSKMTVVFDTGDNPDNMMIFRLSPNEDMITDKDNTPDTFMWNKNDNGPVTILKMGVGTLVFEIPDGVTYQESNNQQTLSYGWFKLLGGVEGSENGVTTYDSSNCNGEYSSIQKPLPYIHSICTGESCSECHYYEEDGDFCQTCKEKAKKENTTSNQRVKKILCTKHDGIIDSYCPVCDSCSSLENYIKENDVNCANRIDKDAVDNSSVVNELYYFKSDDNKKMRIYPDCDIFLIGCSENIDIRLGDTITGKGVMGNGFFGYIYAPYLTIKMDKGGGNGIKLLGGLTVSDYILNNQYGIIGCYPTHMPEEFVDMGNSSSVLESLYDRSWKVAIGSFG